MAEFKKITRNELKKWIDADQDFTLIETLKPEQFEEFHLPGAINIPNNENFVPNVQKRVPDKSQTIVVYCHDTKCNSSPESAKKLVKAGYTNVYDYEEGKMGWKNAGLPIKETAGAKR